MGTPVTPTGCPGVQMIDALEHLGEHRADADQALVPCARRTRRSGKFSTRPRRGAVDVLAGAGERRLGDLGGDLRKAPLPRARARARRSADVERARRVLRERREIGRAAGLVLVLARLDRLDTVTTSAGRLASIRRAMWRQMRRWSSR